MCLGRSECKLTEKDDWPLNAKKLSLAAGTHRTARVIWLCHWTARVIWLCHRTARVIWLYHRTVRVIWLSHRTVRVMAVPQDCPCDMAVPQDCPCDGCATGLPCDMAVPQDCRVIWLCEYAGFIAKPRVGLRVSVVLVL